MCLLKQWEEVEVWWFFPNQLDIQSWTLTYEIHPAHKILQTQKAKPALFCNPQKKTIICWCFCIWLDVREGTLIFIIILELKKNDEFFPSFYFLVDDPRPSTNEAPPIGKIHPFSKIAVSLEPVMQFVCFTKIRIS